MKDQMAGNAKRSVIYGIKKADIVLIIGCLLAAALFGVFFVVHREEGAMVRILYNGTELEEISLYSVQTDSGAKPNSGYYLITYRDDFASVEYIKDRPESKIPEETRYNLISVTDGKVVMEASDCRDQICVHHKPISSKGENIICLPNRIVVEMAGSTHEVVDEFDSIQTEPLDGVVR